MKKIAYITAHTPFGRGETFILEEMLALIEAGVDLVIVPRNPPTEVFHDEAHRLLANTIRLPLLNLQILKAFVHALVFKPRIWWIIGSILRYSRSPRIAAKNLAVLPKSAFVARLFEQEKANHIHAHWGSTTSTMAWIISELTGIPWSFTLHRWDIAENNLLQLKVAHASFVRCTSDDGRQETLNLLDMVYHEKVKVIPQGARIPKKVCFEPAPRDDIKIACPANFVPKKGHKFLIEACAQLAERGLRFKCLLIGSGPLESEIRQQIHLLGLKDFIVLTGFLPHERILSMYETSEVDIVVLPSIVTPDGEREGSPAALKEAMAYGIPVVSTCTGGIPELLRDGAGVLVAPGSAKELADALAQLITDKDFRKSVGVKAQQRIQEEFNWEVFVRTFLKMVELSQ